MPQLTRREWLAAAGCVTASPGFADPPKPVPFGFSLYGMKTLPPTDALRVCAQVGYDGVELATMPGWPTEPKVLSATDRRNLRVQLRDTGLSLLGLMEHLTEPAATTAHAANLDRLKAAADLSHDLAPGTPPRIETVLGGKPADWDQVQGPLVERLAAWADVATRAGAVIAVKPHVGNALHTIAGAQWLIRQVNRPAIRLAFDASHFALRGVSPTAAADALLPLAAFVHIKDAKGTPTKYEFLLPGDGGIDYPAYFQRLKAAGYTGPVVVEVSGMIFNRPGYDPIASAKRCYANIAPALAAAGLRA